MIFFTHIPKCGGKSIKTALEEAFQDKLKLYYNNPLKKNPFAQKMKYALRSLTGEPSYIKDLLSYDVVYGHYCLDDFKRHYKKDGVVTAAFFRDPVEWVGSYLLYHEQKKSVSGLCGEPLQDIRRLKLYQSYQAFLGSMKVEDLKVVGLVEHYDESLQLFQKVTGVSLGAFYNNKTQNAPQSYRSLFAEKGILSQVENLMADNQAIYDRACRTFSLLQKQQ